VVGTSAPRVSIVIPVYNAGRCLHEALRSAAGQTFTDHEIVLVDDGSTDPVTLALVGEAEQRPGISVHRTANRGPSHARNLGIERARGAYILPLDADDWLAPTFLEKTVPRLDADPALGVVYTWVGLVGGHHGVWRTGGFTVPELLARCTIHVTSLYRRELWADVGGYDPRFVESCEDWDLWLGAAARGWRGACVPEVLVYYRRTASSRERSSRQPGTSRRLMHTLATKHRALYEEHLEDALAAMYEQRSEVNLMLERLYAHPVLRLLLRLRGLVRRDGRA
jgi:glycosyltransferase involved in cell wall biosynthesis